MGEHNETIELLAEQYVDIYYRDKVSYRYKNRVIPVGIKMVDLWDWTCQGINNNVVKIHTTPIV